jgi:ribosomal peptide maturation radical SAM protein 1
VPPTVLLLSPPWRPPEEPCLALATLAPILAAAGLAVDVVHGSLRYPRTELDRDFLGGYAAHLFAAAAGDDADVEAALDAIAARMVDELNLQGLVVPGATTLAELGRDEDAMRADLRGELVRARACLDACAAAIEPHHDVVGMSITFESQLPAAVAIARRLKARRPDVRVVVGGAACQGPLAETLLRAFPAIDVVCHGEGEAVIAPLVAALRAQPTAAPSIPSSSPTPSPSAIPGICWRDAGGAIRRNPPPARLDLDALPVPDYDGFVAEHAASPWADVAPRLFFETSRGCWWGQRSLCSFCGLNAESLAFRRKSPARAHDEIVHLYRRYPGARRLQATDNILAGDYLDELMPRLATLPREPGRPLRIFFELRASLGRAQLDLLAAAGVDRVQPGIESFSDPVLALMRKGTTGLGQVQFLKWCSEAGLDVTYNILVRNPDEQAAWYDDQGALIDSIDHLPPPDCVTPVWIERFSPYQQDPAAHGLRGLRARPHSRALWPDATVPLDELAYVFDYDHDMLHDEALFAAVRALVVRVGRWQHDWRPGRLWYRDRGDHLELVDRRADPDARAELVEGPAADVLRALDRLRPRVTLARELPASEVDRVVGELVERRLVARDRRDRHLCVVPRAP